MGKHRPIQKCLVILVNMVCLPWFLKVAHATLIPWWVQAHPQPIGQPTFNCSTASVFCWILQIAVAPARSRVWGSVCGFYHHIVFGAAQTIWEGCPHLGQFYPDKCEISDRNGSLINQKGQWAKWPNENVDKRILGTLNPHPVPNRPALKSLRKLCRYPR